MSSADFDLPWTDEDDDGVTAWDVAAIVISVTLTVLVVWQRTYLMYLSWLLGGLWELYIAVPVLAVVSAMATVWWSWRAGGVHPAAYPVLIACALTLVGGMAAWTLTMT